MTRLDRIATWSLRCWGVANLVEGIAFLFFPDKTAGPSQTPLDTFPPPAKVEYSTTNGGLHLGIGAYSLAASLAPVTATDLSQIAWVFTSVTAARWWLMRSHQTDDQYHRRALYALDIPGAIGAWGLVTALAWTKRT